MLRLCAVLAAPSRVCMFSPPCTSSCLVSPPTMFHLFTDISRGAELLKKATYISLVGDVVKRARDSDCEEDREPGSTGGPLEVLVAVHLHLCGRS
jgi:hypothetical protein